MSRLAAYRVSPLKNVKCKNWKMTTRATEAKDPKYPGKVGKNLLNPWQQRKVGAIPVSQPLVGIVYSYLINIQIIPAYRVWSLVFLLAEFVYTWMVMRWSMTEIYLERCTRRRVLHSATSSLRYDQFNPGSCTDIIFAFLICLMIFSFNKESRNALTIYSLLNDIKLFRLIGESQNTLCSVVIAQINIKQPLLCFSQIYFSPLVQWYF